MNKKMLTRLFALCMGLMLSLSGCTKNTGPGTSSQEDSLSWVTWGGYDNFWELLKETEPDIKMDFIGYSGANFTGYSWMQMRNDDISDLFSTSQILDKDLAAERMADLSDYEFINELSTSLLDQVAIDGDIYFLPVSTSMYGILYNKTLMEEHHWELPRNLTELEALCTEIQKAGLIPGVIGTQLTGNTFSAVFNLAKTSWLTTPEGINWERNFLSGNATAAGMWESTMNEVQKYIDMGMFTTDPEDRSSTALMEDYLAGRKAVFFTMSSMPDSSTLSNGDELGMMPYIGVDGSKNIYMYSPTSYIGVSKRLTEPGKEDKLEKAIRVLSLLFSPEGQATFINDQIPSVMNVLSKNSLPENSMIYDAQQSMREGHAFPMTYAGWEHILSDMGQAFKEWMRGENGMDAAACIARMDELQSNYLKNQGKNYFCISSADFTLEETARLIGMALCSFSGADAAVIPFGTDCKDGVKLRNGITGKLYQGEIDEAVYTSICPGNDGDYAVMTMTGSQISQLVSAGFDLTGDGQPYPYVLVTKDGKEPEDGTVYQTAFLTGSYTKAVQETYNARIEKGSLRTFLRDWLTEQKTVSPKEHLIN